MTDLAAPLRSEMQSFLAGFAGQKVLFIPNEGNVGDCLIFAATLSAFDKAGIAVEVVDDTADFHDRTVFLGGGGNLVDIYRGMRETLEATRSNGARVVLLPHTIRGNIDLIQSLDDRFTIWCRELHSFEHVRKLRPDLDCRLGHDMAFHCDATEFLADPDYRKRAQSLLETGLRDHNTSLERLSELPLVRFMRTDREALSSRVETDLDVSRAFGRVADAETSKIAAWCFLKTISVTQRVVTDRLHVAIACALLGKQCRLLDNSYNKNRGIYAHSLRGFDWLTFDSAAGEKISDQPARRKPFLQRIAGHAHRLTRNR
ncbi:MAG: polysaccharide pyruvyl transferase family protein [Hyphomicrobium sp.]|uniref:polysaccharide pyruvyl transferase family protein n=1 Tax=Hyphomicrobium sp. TaxID=82 RepID=UPI0039E5DEFE